MDVGIRCKNNNLRSGPIIVLKDPANKETSIVMEALFHEMFFRLRIHATLNAEEKKRF